MPHGVFQSTGAASEAPRCPSCNEPMTPHRFSKRSALVWACAMCDFGSQVERLRGKMRWEGQYARLLAQTFGAFDPDDYAAEFG